MKQLRVGDRRQITYQNQPTTLILKDFVWNGACGVLTATGNGMAFSAIVTNIDRWPLDAAWLRVKHGA